MLVKPLLNDDGFFSTIPKSSCLKHVMEWGIFGDSLRLDPERPRSDQLDRRLTERPARTGIMDLRATLLVAYDVPSAVGPQMLILGKDRGIGDADVPSPTVGTADLPQSAHRLREDGRPHGGGEQEQ
jgi:hypothetical protein